MKKDSLIQILFFIAVLVVLLVLVFSLLIIKPDINRSDVIKRIEKITEQSNI